jgi:hypothetical protein
MIRSFLVIATALASLVVWSNDASAEGFGGRFAGARHGGMGGGAPSELGANIGWVSRSSWGDYSAYNQSMQKPWHGNYYWLRTGQPTALVVPPTVTMQSNYSWGVSQNTMTPVWHQFSGKAANGGGGGMFHATPYWPSHTDQFGVYPVRGPW